MLASSSAGIAAFALAPHVRARGDDSLPRLPSFDEEMERYMTEREIPGGTLAVARNGKLIYARGYGRADRERAEPVAPDLADEIGRLAGAACPHSDVGSTAARSEHHFAEGVTTAQQFRVGSDEYVPGEIADDAHVARHGGHDFV